MKTVIGLLTAGFLFTALFAYAGSNDTPGIDRRQAHQEPRIQKGIDSGQLTGREANRLNKRVDRIERMEEKAKADGQVTKKERKRLHKRLNKNSKGIAKQKHDRQGKHHR